MSNFDFLKGSQEYALFADAAIEAERVFSSSAAACAVGCRKALELAVKWMYAADRSLEKPYNDNVQALIHEPSFRKSVGQRVWNRLPLIIKLGNIAVNTRKVINKGETLDALEGLFEFIEWIDFCYGEAYIERKFDADKIPKTELSVDLKKIKDRQALVALNEDEIYDACRKVEAKADSYTEAKADNLEYRSYLAKDMSEFETRKSYINVDLMMSGWTLPPETLRDVEYEYPVEGMMDIEGQPGFVDYVLMGRNGKPLALVEAKRTTRDPKAGQKQARLYADCLEKQFGVRPMIFLSNGFETHFWDDTSQPPRIVSGIFSKDDLERLMQRRETVQQINLLSVPVDDNISGRYYQKEAVRAVCEAMQKGIRKHLLVMATGTGKTRTAVSLVDVLSRAERVKNVLFLADRVALVKQARDAFVEHLPRFPLCRLGFSSTTNDDDDPLTARVVISTYPTMLNQIDDSKTGEDGRLFTPAHFDLIIVDESHRSIFNKYKAIFDYFDAQVVGLTATPRNEVDLNTYSFFELEPNVPTYNYDYETAVYSDHVLVPFYNYEVKTKFLAEGIYYDELSEVDKLEYERIFGEFGDDVPEFIPPEQLFKFLYAEDTVDKVFQDLMERGIKVKGGDTVGKTIIFAQSQRHADFIVERFNKLYPQYNGKFAQRIVCGDSYVQQTLDDFKNADKADPQIAISVDMLDTGVDVPEIVNLVFFKKTYSKIKFEQMIGRGTRLCRGLTCTDEIDGEYTGKRRFMIFDYCGNFEFFRKNKNLFEGKEVKSLTEKIFCKRIDIAAALQHIDYVDAEYQTWRSELTNTCCCQIKELNSYTASVRQHLAAVERFKNEEEFADLNRDNKIYTLKKELAPLVFMDDTDEFAKRFDNLVYGLMLAKIKDDPKIKVAKRQIQRSAVGLSGKISIPQVAAKADLLKKIMTEEFWEDADLLTFENMRRELRGLLKFLAEGGTGNISVITSLTDHIVDSAENVPFIFDSDNTNYKAKVNRYIAENRNNTVIYKLTHNKKLTAYEFRELERIFTEELGGIEDYRAEYGETPFGLLVRKIAHLDHEAAREAFSQFINDESLNTQQIEFINKIINHIEQNGCMENISVLMKHPFDRPRSIVQLFDRNNIIRIQNTLKEIEKNACGWYEDNVANTRTRAAQP